MTIQILAAEVTSALFIQNYNQGVFSNLSLRFLINLISVITLVRFIYFPIYKQREFVFTYLIFNVIIFLLAFVLNKVDLSMGAAFGLFAVFSILRYKTEEIAIKDMTYLFLCIAIGLISAVAKFNNGDFEFLFLIGIHTIVLVITYLLESNMLIKRESVNLILYENIELVKANRKDDLLADLKSKTGLNIHRYTIYRIDFLKDAVEMKIYYYDK
jgi:hypothetical protein